MDEVKGYIYETKDYDKFKKLVGNRFVDHSDKIVESIKNCGQLISPIVVNEKFEIIDGQNRFEAYKALGLPVQYTIVNGYGINECIAMNSVSKNWNVYDYIKSYAELGNEEYKFAQEMIDKYRPHMSTQTILAVISGNIDFFSNKAIRNGSFKIGKDGGQFYDDVMNFLCQFDLKAIRGSTEKILKVLAFCYTDSEVDNTKLVRFFQKYSYLVESVVDTKQAAEAVEKIYNWKCNKENYVFIASKYQQYAMAVQTKNIAPKKNKAQDASD